MGWVTDPIDDPPDRPLDPPDKIRKQLWRQRMKSDRELTMSSTFTGMLHLDPDATIETETTSHGTPSVQLGPNTVFFNGGLKQVRDLEQKLREYREARIEDEMTAEGHA